MSRYFYGNQPVSEAEAVMPNGTLRDGYRFAGNLMLKDRAADTSGGHVSRNGVGYSSATAARQRAADQARWRAIGAAYVPTQGVRPIGDGRAVTSASQAAYQKRISDAWKETDALPERRPHADAASNPVTPVENAAEAYRSQVAAKRVTQAQQIAEYEAKHRIPVRDTDKASTSASQAQYEARVREAWRQAG